MNIELDHAPFFNVWLITTLIIEIKPCLPLGISTISFLLLIDFLLLWFFILKGFGFYMPLTSKKFYLPIRIKNSCTSISWHKSFIIFKMNFPQMMLNECNWDWNNLSVLILPGATNINRIIAKVFLGSKVCIMALRDFTRNS